MSQESVYDSAHSLMDVSSLDLVSLLVNAKKDLQHAQVLASDAQHLADDAVQISNELASLRCDVGLVENLIESQTKVVETFRQVLKARRSEYEAAIKATISQTRTTTQRLNITLDGLSQVAVDADIVPHLEYSHSHESLFGSQGSTSSHTHGVRAPRGDRAHGKTLRDFVDEQSLDLVLDSSSEDRNALEDILASHANLSKLLSRPPALTASLGTKDVAGVLDEILHAMAPPNNDFEGGLLSEMARELEGLGIYFDALTDAVQSRGSGGLTRDELQVLKRDSDEVPSIMTDLEQAYRTIQVLHETLKDELTKTQTHMQSLETIVSQLDAIGLEMADISAEEAQLSSQIPERLEGLRAHQGALEELDAYYGRYELAYTALVKEMERRRRWLDEVDDVVQATWRKLEVMREDEFRARSDFVQEHGEFLPDDLCPTIADGPPDIDHLLLPYA